MMTTTKDQINIELPNRRVLQLIETRSRDVVFAVAVRDDQGNMTEIAMAVIPYNRRDLVQQYIKP